MILAAMMLMTLTAKAISYGDAKSEALFLSDKMVYELDLTDEQYEAVYEINLDYLLCVNNPRPSTPNRPAGGMGPGGMGPGGGRPMGGRR